MCMFPLYSDIVGQRHILEHSDLLILKQHKDVTQLMSIGIMTNPSSIRKDIHFLDSVICFHISNVNSLYQYIFLEFHNTTCTILSLHILSVFTKYEITPNEIELKLNKARKKWDRTKILVYTLYYHKAIAKFYEMLRSICYKPVHSIPLPVKPSLQEQV